VTVSFSNMEGRMTHAAINASSVLRQLCIQDFVKPSAGEISWKKAHIAYYYIAFFLTYYIVAVAFKVVL